MFQKNSQIRLMRIALGDMLEERLQMDDLIFSKGSLFPCFKRSYVNKKSLISSK